MAARLRAHKGAEGDGEPAAATRPEVPQGNIRRR
jgi:hypothetical protein